MSYVALYRKYRPDNFDSVIGQKVTIEILKNSIINNKISHAYLFNGPRGTGKTSVAKIFAKAVNCLDNKNGNACGMCELCKKIQKNDIDIIEIDAASNNGVEEIREIRSKVKLLPSVAKYKVYIIDEVHMLSTGAFNALLKTLEEPPSHVIFILCTTEIQKIPLTILSRCQHFEFKKINSEEMFDSLKKISKLENRNISDNVISLIVKLSDGGCRDAINLLDQVLSLSVDNINEKEIYDIQGILPEEDIMEFLNTMSNNDMISGLNYINSFVETGKNLSIIVDQLLVLLRNISISKNVNNYFSKDDQEKYNSFNFTLENVKELTKLLIELKNQMNKSVNQKNLFEIFYIYMCDVVVNKSNDNYDKIKNDNLEVSNDKEIKDESSDKTKKVDYNDENSINIDSLKKIRINNVLATANKEELKKINSSYERINDFISNKVYNNVATLLLDGKVIVASSQYLLFVFEDKSLIRLFLTNLEKIEKFLKELYNNEYKVMCVDSNEWIKIKNEFILNKKNNIIYKVCSESEFIGNKKISKFEHTTSDIFGEDIEIVN